MKVWRVFNGSMGFCSVHRIVVAETDKDAIRDAMSAGMMAKQNQFTADYVCDAESGCVEKEDYD